MQSKIYVIAAVIGVLLVAGCAGEHEYTVGQRFLELKQYEEAVAHAEKAVEEDSSNKKYRALLDAARKAAAESEYNRGLFFYGKNQIGEALDAFRKAIKYDPGFEDARRAYESAAKRRDIISKVLTEIPALMAAGRPDEALKKVIEVQPYSADFPGIRKLKAKALQQSTVLHIKRGNVSLKNGDYENARTEFQIALNRSPGSPLAVEGLSKTMARIKAAGLVAQGKKLIDQGRFAQGYAKFDEALRIVPGYPDAVKARVEAGSRWAKALCDEARALEKKGGFDNLAEALRRWERAGALAEPPSDLDGHIAALKKTLAGEFAHRGRQYEELGQEYLGLALVNYLMALHCNPGQAELSRKVVSLKEAFDKRRAFYIDIRSADESSKGASFSKQLTQTLKKTVISSGIKDLYVVAPYNRLGMPTGLSEERGLAGRRLTIFTSLLSEDVIVKGSNKPETVRSYYKIGTRNVPNPQYAKARQNVADLESREIQAKHDYEDALADYRNADPADKEALWGEVETYRQDYEDAEDDTAKARKVLANTDEWIEQEVTQPYNYTVYTVTMEAKVEVGISVADPDTGAYKDLETISGTSKAQDTYNEGVQATDTRGVEVDPKELPTKSELLISARADAAQKTVAWLKGILTELSMQYYERAKQAAEIGNIEGAAEYYYAFYLCAPDKHSPKALEAIEYVRNQTHLITPDERTPPVPERLRRPGGPDGGSLCSVSTLVFSGWPVGNPENAELAAHTAHVRIAAFRMPADFVGVF